MDRNQFDDFCAALPATTHVIQWGGSSVWKVGGKIFAICSHWGTGNHAKISFKCSEMSYTLLREEDGIIPAPYLARAQWVQLERPDAMSEADIQLYIEEAHRIITGKLTRAARAALGLQAREARRG
ncbi:MAG: MmcQ/YjbR family DNA-binding protein [Proteobacteria bacterium]|nr:MmcQ/YjbR family DNA-binding protein [Pseudomonadota bacterium]MDA1310215.1 MmcQ/YjbR family DNA-binding protein [Pseudomonadota bacterium]